MRAAEVGFVTARGYRAAKSRPASARTLSDQLIGGEIVRLHAENYGVYGVRKMHRLLGRQGWEIGRDQTGRLMRSLDLPDDLYSVTGDFRIGDIRHACADIRNAGRLLGFAPKVSNEDGVGQLARWAAEQYRVGAL